MSTIILDTNAYSSYLSGDKEVLSVLTNADICYLSIFVLGELYAGFKGGNREKENLDILQTFIKKRKIAVLPASNDTAVNFAHIKNELKKAGTPLPVNDIWIAAHALETQAMVVTYDQHFSKIPEIHTWSRINSPPNWQQAKQGQ